MVYNFQKKLESEAIEELYGIKNQEEEDELKKIKIHRKEKKIPSSLLRTPKSKGQLQKNI
jgi:hypothetical protein